MARFVLFCSVLFLNTLLNSSYVIGSEFVLQTCEINFEGSAEGNKSGKKGEKIKEFNELPFHRIRYEGISAFEGLLNIGGYLKKYKHKRFNDFHYYKPKSVFSERGEDKSKDVDAEKNCLRVGFAGDIMWVGKVSPGFVSEGVISELGKYDVLIANLETPVDKTKRVPSLLPDYLKYNSDEELLKAFYSPKKGENHLTAVSLANNHALDKGSKGILNTMQALDSMGILHTGASAFDEQYNYITFEKGGIKVGMYAATFGVNFNRKKQNQSVKINHINGITAFNADTVNLNEIKAILAKMKKDSVDLKIVFLHWGYEFELFPDPLIQNVAHQIAMTGADIVAGSHPHVFQPIEIIYMNDTLKHGIFDGDQLSDFQKLNNNERKTLVLYSLGNFISRMKTAMCRIGVIVSVTIEKDSLSGKLDWNFDGMDIVYNKATILPGKKHKLMLYSEYEENYLNRNTKRAIRNRQESEFAIRHISNTN